MSHLSLIMCLGFLVWEYIKMQFMKLQFVFKYQNIVVRAITQ